MHHKNILLVSATTRLHERMRELSHVIDVSIALANAASFSQAAASGHTFDLIILDQKELSSACSGQERFYFVYCNYPGV